MPDSPRAHRTAVAGEVRALAALPEARYVYACEVTARDGDARSAEQWARAVFEGAPSPLRRIIVAGWMAGLGLRLASRRSPSHVLGWSIVSTSPTAAVLAADSPLLAARLVVHLDGSRVTHATFVHCRNAAGRIVWAVAALLHQRILPLLLSRAARQPG